MTQRLNSLIASNNELRQLAVKVRQLHAIQTQYQSIVPSSLSRSSHVILLDQGNLILAADNGPVAAKLRQMVPELIKQLQLNDCEVTGIQVKVQVNTPPLPVTPLPSKLSATGKQQLSRLADSLNDSPLKNALMRLAGSKKNSD